MESAVRNLTTTAITFRLENPLARRLEAASVSMGMKKSKIYERLIAAYLDGRLGTLQTDLPMPPTPTEEDLMAVAKKSKAAVKAKAAPAAKAKTAAAKKK